MTELGEQPLSHVFDTRIDAGRGRNTIIMVGGASFTPAATGPDMWLRMIWIIKESFTAKRCTRHVQWFKYFTGDKPLIINPRVGGYDVTNQTKNNILISIALTGSTNKIDPIQSFHDSIIRHIVLNQIRIGMWHQTAGLRHEVFQANFIAVVWSLEIQLCE